MLTSFDDRSGIELLYRDPWMQAAGVLAAGVIGLVAMFWGTAASAVETWYGSDLYNYGFLIVPISAALIWLRRESIMQVAPRPSLWGLAPMAFAAFVWLTGRITGAVVVEQFALVAMIQAVFFIVVGGRAFARMAFPLFYLYLAVPVGGFLIAPLQQVTADLAVWMLRLSGVPVFHDGYTIATPAGDFIVAEACAGLRYLLTTIALGLLGAFLLFRALWRRLLFVALSLAVPILANCVRAYGIIMTAQLSDIEFAAGIDHVIAGWVFLTIVTLCLFALGMTFRDRKRNSHHEAAAPDTPTRRANGLRGLLAAGMSLFVAGSALAYGNYIGHRHTELPLPRLDRPAVEPPWSTVPEADTSWRPQFHGADAEMFGTYASDGQRADLYIAFYRNQRQSAEVINAENRLADYKIWRDVDHGHGVVVIDQDELTVEATRIAAPGRRRLVWLWYWVDGRFTSDRMVAKFLEAKAKLLGADPAAAAIVVAADYQDKPEEAAALIRDLLQHMVPLDAALARAVP